MLPDSVETKAALTKNEEAGISDIATRVNTYNNSRVNNLYNQYSKNLSVSGNFAFRKQILSLALDLFRPLGSLYIFANQKESTYISQLHIDFLVDTILFIYTGKRTVNISTWNRMLALNEASTTIDTSKLDKLIDNTVDSPYGALSSTPEKLVQDWCSNENGIEDLLCTLYILLGTNNLQAS